jgi:hypothetical protein
MTHVLQVLFLSVFILQVVMHGEESQVINDNIPARTSPGLTRSSFATTRNRVANDIHIIQCHPRKVCSPHTFFDLKEQRNATI